MESKEYYSKIAHRYITVDDPFSYRYHQRRFDSFNSLLPPAPKRILDFGCGSGENVINLTRLGYSVLGIDPVPEMVEIAKTKMEANGFDAGLIHLADLGNLALLKDAQLDVAAALNVLPYLSEEQEAEFYIQAKRLTADDGLVIVSHTNELVNIVTKSGKIKPFCCV